MSAMTPFEMKITDLFRFADGRTVFVGPIEGDVKFVPPCRCELLVDGVPTCAIQIEGEMIPNRTSPEGYRSISTRDAVCLERQLLSTSECHLRSASYPVKKAGSDGAGPIMPDSANGTTARR